MKLTEAERAEIGDLADQPVNIKSLSRKYKVSRQTIRTWLSRGTEERPDFTDAPRSGRPPLLNATKRASVRRHMHAGDTAGEIAERLERYSGLHVSLNTVRRVAPRGREPRRWGQIECRAFLSDKTRELRLLFCKEHQGDDFGNYVFLDQFEKHVHFDKRGWGASKGYMWRSVKHPEILRKPTCLWYFRFYCAIGRDFKWGPYFVPTSPPEGTRSHKSKETYKATHWIQLMRDLKAALDERYPGGNYVIIRDHARQHTAKASEEAMNELGLPILKDYTASSWDINVIESLWGVYRGKLKKAKGKSTDQWYKIFRDAWDNISMTTINKLIDGAPARVQSIIDAKGQWVPHH